jgi:hypothetical protein
MKLEYFLILFIVNIKNMLEIEKASHLVFVFSSLQLKDTMFDSEYKDQFVKWLNEDENSN